MSRGSPGKVPAGEMVPLNFRGACATPLPRAPEEGGGDPVLLGGVPGACPRPRAGLPEKLSVAEVLDPEIFRHPPSRPKKEIFALDSTVGKLFLICI